VQEVTQVLVRVAKARRMPVLLIGQSTRENAVAGPRAMEHMVDTVLTFEGDKHTSLRLLRAVKNRYGPADEVVCFEQCDDGLREVPGPVRPVPQPPRRAGAGHRGRGRGRRPARGPGRGAGAGAATASPNPRRGRQRPGQLPGGDAAGGHRAHRRHQLDRDVFVATVGRRQAVRPRDRPRGLPRRRLAPQRLPDAADVAVIGEVALSGDIRPVGHLAQRVGEAARLGYRRSSCRPGSLRG
jgi:DNA repair protein RadA/Sms